MSLSIGVACLPEDAADPEGLLTAAEAALRGAKRGGPGRVHFFSAGRRRRAARTTQPAVQPHARARGRSVPPVPGADERGHVDPQPRSLAVVPARRSVAPAPRRARSRRRAPQRDLRSRRGGARSPARRGARSRRPHLPLRRRRRLPRHPRAARRAAHRSRGARASGRARRRGSARADGQRGAARAAADHGRLRRACSATRCSAPSGSPRAWSPTRRDNARNLARAQGAPRSHDAAGRHPRRRPDLGVPADRRSRHRRHLRVRGADPRPARHRARVAGDAVRDRRRGRSHRRARSRVLPRRAAQRDDARAGPPAVREPAADVVLRRGVHRGRGRQPAHRRRPDAREHRVRDHRAARDRELRVVQARARARTPRWASASRSTTSARGTRTSRP